MEVHLHDVAIIFIYTSCERPVNPLSSFRPKILSSIPCKETVSREWALEAVRRRTDGNSDWMERAKVGLVLSSRMTDV